MAALSSPAPVRAPSDDDNFHLSLYQYVLHGHSKAGVPPAFLGQADLSATATTTDFVELVLQIARQASAAASAGAAGATPQSVDAAFDIPVEKIGCGTFARGYQQKNFRMFAFQARKQGLTDATSAQLCSEYFGPKRDIVVVLKPGATPGIVYDPKKDPTLKKKSTMRPGAPGGPPPMR